MQKTSDRGRVLSRCWFVPRRLPEPSAEPSNRFYLGLVLCLWCHRFVRGWPIMKQIKPVLDGARAAFNLGKTRPLEFRIQQLKALERMLTEKKDRVLEALQKDLHKNEFAVEVYEMTGILGEITLAINKLPEWMAPEHVSKSMMTLMDTIYIHREPLGVVLILGTWNYPLALILQPLVGAIAAGNAAVLKPSEVSGNTAQLLADLIPQYLDKELYPVITGGPEEAAELLKHPFDHILYTGSAAIGRIVLEAAAKHLTPVTLELGGKSPCYIDSNCDLDVACRRIAWGRYTNCGQTCIAPDYILCDKSIQDEVVKKIGSTITEFYGSDPQKSPDYGRIVNQRHFRRIMSLLEGVNVAYGGQNDEGDLYIAPTVVTDVDPDSRIMQEEIFGPLLPIVTVGSVDEAIAFINKRDKPLALYVFSHNKKGNSKILIICCPTIRKFRRFVTWLQLIKKMIAETSSGAVTANDCFIHYSILALPFGGVGKSGFGAYHGKHSFETFSHRQSCVLKSLGMERVNSIRYAPASDSKQKWILWLLKQHGGGKKMQFIGIMLLGVLVSIVMKVLTQVMNYTLNFINSAFSGHLGKYELGAISLASSVISVMGVAVGTGLSMACDTMISQMYGSKKLKRIGVVLQRAILILVVFCCPCWALFINTEKILLAAKQDPEVARLCQLYVKIFIPALPAVFLYQIQVRYLQNQGIIMPQVLTGLAANVLSIIMNYSFLTVLKLGVVGSACANLVAQYCQVIMLLAYIRWSKLYLHTWGGWTSDCLQEWGSFLRLAIPSMVMFCTELWAYEMGSFLAGLINPVQLGAQAVIFQFLTVLYMIHVGIGMAAGVRVGMALGAGLPQQAKVSAMTALVCTGCVALILMALLLMLKDVIPKIFTSDRQIIELVSSMIPILAPFHLCDAIGSGVASGIVRGIGMQKAGAIANLVVFYVVGIPVGISLMFAAKLGILGLWVGLAISTFLLSAFLLTLIFRMDWSAAVEEARERTGLKTRLGPTTAAELCPPENGDTLGLSQSHEETDQPEGSSLLVRRSSCLSEDILSPAQLIVRRGLLALAGLVVLAVGIAVHFTEL